ncbi:AMP-binding protein [Oerskovia sp. M15]
MFDRIATAAAKARAAGKPVDLHSIRLAFAGAMPISPTTARTWENATGGLLIEGYGMTETSPVALGNPVSADRRPGTLGLPSRAPTSASSTRTTRPRTPSLTSTARSAVSC